MKISHNRSRTCLKIFLFCLSLLLTSRCIVSERHATKKQGDAPSAISGHTQYPCHDCSPERIILNVTENPSNSQAVTWRTCIEKGDDSKAQIASATDSPAFMENSRTIHAVSEKISVGKEDFVYHHAAVFSDLKPNTMYAYRVGTGDNWSEWNHFQTADKSPKPFTFVYLSDPQEDVKSMSSRIFRAAYKKAPEANFWLFTGDLVDNGDKDPEWAELFYAFGWIPRTTPMILLPGNHEYPDRRYVKGPAFKLFPLWRPHFTLPQNGPRGLEETAYFIDYQGARFVMLNGNEKLEEQAGWLDKILSENPQPWTIVGIHQPVYSTAKSRSDSKRQDLLVPIFDKHAVDLVLQGHDHTYCRSYKIRNGVRAGENEKGTVYVISVSGPKVYEVKTHHEGLMAKMETGRQLFQVIHIDHDRLFYQSFDVKGDVFDFFTLERQQRR